jgi:hypothetical protein
LRGIDPLSQFCLQFFTFPAGSELSRALDFVAAESLHSRIVPAQVLQLWVQKLPPSLFSPAAGPHLSIVVSLLFDPAREQGATAGLHVCALLQIFPSAGLQVSIECVLNLCSRGGLLPPLLTFLASVLRFLPAPCVPDLRKEPLLIFLAAFFWLGLALGRSPLLPPRGLLHLHEPEHATASSLLIISPAAY